MRCWNFSSNLTFRRMRTGCFPSFPKKSQLASTAVDRSSGRRASSARWIIIPVVPPQTRTHDRWRFQFIIRETQADVPPPVFDAPVYQSFTHAETNFSAKAGRSCSVETSPEKKAPEAFKNFEPLAIKFTEYH